MTAPAPHSCVRAGKTQESAGLRHALRDIEETSREAADELRRMLGVLREDPGPSSPSPLSMPEDLEHALAGAVGRARRAGVTVEVGAEPGNGSRRLRRWWRRSRIGRRAQGPPGRGARRCRWGLEFAELRVCGRGESPWMSRCPVLSECSSLRIRCFCAPRSPRSRALSSTWRSSVGRPTGARDRAQLVIAAYEAGLVRPGN